MALPTYKKQAQQVAAPQQVRSGDMASESLMASAQVSNTLAQRLQSFSQSLGGLAKSAAVGEASKEAVRDIHKRKEMINEINEDPSLTEDERIAKIADIQEGASRAFSGVYSKAYENAATAAYSNQITVDTNEASMMAIEASQGDPEAYIKQMNAFRDETVKTAPTEETGIIAELAINEYGKKGYRKLKEAQFRIDEAKRKATFADTTNLQALDSEEYLQQGDWINGSQSLFKLQQTLQNGIDNGWETPEGAELKMMRATESGIIAYAKDRISMLEPVQAQKFIDDFRSGSYEKEIPTEFYDVDNEKLADRMEYLLEKELRVRDNQKQTVLKQNNDDVKDIIYLLDQGEDVPGEILTVAWGKEIKPEVRENLERAMNDNGYMKYFDSKNLTEQSDLIAELRDKEDKTADELRLQKKYEKHYKAGLKAIDDDPLVYSSGKAFKEELEPLNLQDRDMMVKATRRMEQVRQAKEYTNRRVGLFTKQEVSTIKDQLKGMNSTEKLDLMSNINLIDDEDIRDDTYRQIGGTFSFAGGLTVSGNMEGAKTALLGKGADVSLPEGFKKDLQTALGDVYSGFQGEVQSSTMEGITDYAKGLILAGEDAEDIKEVISNTIGSVVKYNNKKTIVPYGVKRESFENWLDNIEIEGRPGLSKGLRDITDVWGSGDYQLHYAGSNGKYYVKFKDEDGQMKTARDTDNPNRPFILDWNAQ